MIKNDEGDLINEDELIVEKPKMPEKIENPPTEPKYRQPSTYELESVGRLRMNLQKIQSPTKWKNLV